MLQDEKVVRAAKEARDEAKRAAAWLLALFGSTLFLSALLLFSVQPLVAKLVLPRLGGTPAVWSVAMVFFQATLLAGYLYAHVLVRHAAPARGLAIHVVLMASALLWLPIAIPAGFDSPPESWLPLWLLVLLAATAGIPFLAVSANAPLLQAWFARTGHPHAADPYFLYGASNLGSVLALIAYPIVAEPLLTLGEQTRLWAGLYLVLAASVLVCGTSALAARRGASAAAVSAQAAGTQVVWRERGEWIALAFLPSALLVAVTAHLSTDIAAMPLLWTLPLAMFLLTFVVAFQRKPLIAGRLMEILVPFAAVAAILTYGFPGPLGGMPGIAINLLAFFVIALAWHSALVARRPGAAHLTDFYLCMSVGGVLGGAFTSLAAPVLFNSVVEFPLLLALSLLVVPESRKLLRTRRALAFGAFLVAASLAAFAFDSVDHRDRSFFGVVSTRITDGVRVLAHGTTIHGAQRLADMQPGRRPEPLTYYVDGGPLAGAMAIEQAASAAPLDIAVVGLGVGSLACHGRPQDRWRFYEIDPAVIAVATDPSLFTLLSACAPDAAIVRGDARLSLAEEPDQNFDVLVVDAFSSDAIPVHLLTREALALYVRKLRPDGVIVMHISNRFMELASVVAAGAAAEGLSSAEMLHLRSGEEVERLAFSSDAIVIARERARLADYLASGWSPLDPPTGISAWTDDYSNVIGAILRKQGLL
jgi:hypothetical protein